MQIILIGADGKVGTQVLKSLRSHRIDASISKLELNSPDFPEYARQCCPQMAMPVFRPEYLAQNKKRFPQNTVIPIESFDKLSLLDNKVSASNLASRLGIPQPKLYASADDIASYPVVFKRAKGLGGAGVYFPRDRHALDNLCSASRENSYLLMEYIDGYDVSVDVLRWDSFFTAGAYRNLFPKSKSVAMVRCSVKAPELIDYARQMLDAIDYKGVCGFDFRIDREGKAYFLECNPRFTGGFATQLRSGFDQAYLYWMLASGQSSPEEIQKNLPKYRSGVVTIDWKGLFDYLKVWITRRC